LSIEIDYIQKMPTSYVPDDEDNTITQPPPIIVYDIINYVMDLGIDIDDDDDEDDDDVLIYIHHVCILKIEYKDFLYIPKWT